MAASLDEIQLYELFQYELENWVNGYVETLGSVKQRYQSRYVLNAFIEYASYNRFIESIEQIDDLFVKDFTEWLSIYSNGEISKSDDLYHFLSYCNEK